MGTTAAVQSLLARAQEMLQRGRGADAAHLLGPALKSGALTHFQLSQQETALQHHYRVAADLLGD